MNILEKLGLSSVEAKIYEVLLNNGALSIAALAEKTGLYRPQIYQYLPGLIQKDLVSESRRGKRKIYSAESPQQLEKIAEDIKTEVLSNIPELMQKYNVGANRPMISYFEGAHGISHVFDDMARTCKKGDVIYRYESPRDFSRNKKYYPPSYIKRFATGESEIEKFVITNEKTQKTRRPRLERYSKAIPQVFDLFEYDITQLIYGDKVAFIDYEREVASIIEDPVFAEFQKKIFKFIFKQL